ncbi:hypothetical protein [Azospirillum himalayense]|uniref:Uncharacterized protein n=1 Tax=Azospirillum himalayense TaxID=654847 RepID=A0ABW0FYT2_9PROT
MEMVESGTQADAIVAALVARGITETAADPSYNLVWVKVNGVVAGIISGYDGCEADTFAIIDRFGDNYGGDDYGYTLDEAMVAVAAYIQDGKTYDTRASTNVLVDDGKTEDLNWNTVDLSDGIDGVLEAEAGELRDDAFRGDLDTMDWEDAELYVRIFPEGYNVELARVPVFTDAEGPESYEAKRKDGLEADLEAEVVLSPTAIRTDAGLGDDEDIEAFVDAIEKAIGTWSNGENCLGLNIFSCQVGTADEDDDGEVQVSVSCDREIFQDDAAKLQDELEEFVRDTIAGVIADRDWENESE